MTSSEKTKRLGLALSGGGFRASFYHIGVLARMAELGMLKHVESISTVSGGSIVGAAYYLLLKELLEHKADIDIVIVIKRPWSAGRDPAQLQARLGKNQQLRRV